MGKLMSSSPGVESFEFLIASSSSLNLNSSSISFFQDWYLICRVILLQWLLPALLTI